MTNQRFSVALDQQNGFLKKSCECSNKALKKLYKDIKDRELPWLSESGFIFSEKHLEKSENGKTCFHKNLNNSFSATFFPLKI